MFFDSLLQLSIQEKDKLNSFSISDSAKQFLIMEMEKISADYFEIEPKINIEPEIMKELLEFSQIKNNLKIQKAAEKIKKEKLEIKYFLANESFFKNLGSLGLGELIDSALSIEDNLIIPENIKYLCALINLRNQIRIEEKHYYENLEQIALKEKIRRLQKKHDLLLRRKKILMQAEEQGKIKKLKETLTEQI